MSARDNILARIRAAQGRSGTATVQEREAVAAHIRAQVQGPRPRSDWEPCAWFRQRVLALNSTLAEVPALGDVPQAVASYLSGNGLPRGAVCWPEFGGLEWRTAGMEVDVRAAQGSDLVGITGAFCAIAETGSLMLMSGPGTPSTTSLLPETHIVILSKARIVRGMEDAWQLLRSEFAAMPRAVNLISGPSRTADIEQTLVLGAHGPYRVHIVLVP